MIMTVHTGNWTVWFTPKSQHPYPRERIRSSRSSSGTKPEASFGDIYIYIYIYILDPGSGKPQSVKSLPPKPTDPSSTLQDPHKYHQRIDSTNMSSHLCPNLAQTLPQLSYTYTP
jgi:hypothetical protein